MKKRVIYRSVGYFYLDVEADTVEEAKEIADNTDGSEFTELDGYGEWYYDSTEDDQGIVIDREESCIRQSAITESGFYHISAGLPPVGVPLIVTVKAYQE